MGDDRQPEWAAAMAEIMALADAVELDLPSMRIDGDDALSTAIATAARGHEEAIAESYRAVADSVESTIVELQRELAIRLDLK